MFWSFTLKPKLKLKKKITHAFKLLCVGGWSTRALLLEGGRSGLVDLDPGLRPAEIPPLQFRSADIHCPPQRVVVIDGSNGPQPATEVADYIVLLIRDPVPRPRLLVVTDNDKVRISVKFSHLAKSPLESPLGRRYT